jgi:hypothetical protein
MARNGILAGFIRYPTRSWSGRSARPKQRIAFRSRDYRAGSGRAGTGRCPDPRQGGRRESGNRGYALPVSICGNRIASELGSPVGTASRAVSASLNISGRPRWGSLPGDRAPFWANPSLGSHPGPKQRGPALGSSAEGKGKERIDCSLERTSAPLHLGQEKSSLERGEQRDGEIVGVDVRRELPVGMKSSESIADRGRPLHVVAENLGVGQAGERRRRPASPELP